MGKRTIKKTAKAAANTTAKKATKKAVKDETLYCSCKRASFGEMVGCDNPNCPIEWYHFECVGMQAGAPTPNEWFCPKCIHLQQPKMEIDDKPIEQKIIQQPSAQVNQVPMEVSLIVDNKAIEQQPSAQLNKIPIEVSLINDDKPIEQQSSAQVKNKTPMEISLVHDDKAVEQQIVIKDTPSIPTSTQIENVPLYDFLSELVEIDIEHKKPVAQATGKNKKRAAPEKFDLSNLNDDNDDEAFKNIIDYIDEADDNNVQLFRLNASIVGKRHYSGSINQGEVVKLVREPNNPYDRNAIKVMTTGHQQAGHIEAKLGTAATLSKILDGKVLNKGKKVDATIEAICFTGNTYSSTAQLTLISELCNKQPLFDYLNSGPVPFLDIMSNTPYKGFQYVKSSSKSTKQSSFSSSSSSSAISNLVAGVNYNVKLMSNDDVIREFDRLFDQEQQEINAMVFNPTYYPNFGRLFSSTLYSHQEKAVAWMIAKETKPILSPLFEEISTTNYANLLTKTNQNTKPLAPTGGLLLDDMGLGKSACVLALMLCNPPPLVEYPSNTNARVDDYDDDDDDSNNEQVNEDRCPTLIICPLSVISAWETQFKIHIKKNKLRVCTYHGNSRCKSNTELQSYDVVITNYDSLSSDYKSLSEEKKKRKIGGNLMSISWFRVVLDESHTIRNLNTIVTKSILQLKAKNKWALSGTIMPNSVKDLEAPFLFLGVHPLFEEKRIASSSSSSTAVKSASTTIKESNGYFQRFIVRELKAGNGEALVHLKTLMGSLALKRTKAVISTLMPQKTEQIVHVQLNPAEKDAYDAIQNVISDYVARQSLDDYSTVLGFLTRLRQACLDIRLVPPDALVRLLATAKNTKTSSSTGTGITLSKKEQEDLLKQLESIFSVARNGAQVAVDDDEGFENVECCICLDNFNVDSSVIFSVCKHTICSTCDKDLFKDTQSQPCPYCRQIITKKDRIHYEDLMRELEESRARNTPIAPTPNASNDHSSSKTKAVIDMLTTTGNDKVVIFSQFVGYLDFLHVALVREGYKVVQITGKLTQKERTKVLLKFTTDASIKIVLCSTKACGVGINLNVANHVYLTDMWWSPAVDHQAIDRVHRLGQKKEVTVVKFVVANSIDEKIMEIQKKKILQTKTLLESGKDRSKEEKKADLAYLLGV